MSLNASAVLVISAAFHALWNFTLKRSSHRIGTSLGLMVGATLLNATYALATAHLPDFSSALIVGVLFAGICEGFYFFLLTSAYAKQSLGVAYTIMRGGAMILVWIISTISLGEAITSTDAVSIALIFVGIGFIQQSMSWRDLVSSGIYAAYICAGCIAGYHIGYGTAVRTGAAPALVFAASMACGVVTFLACDRGKAVLELRQAFSRERYLLISGSAMCGLSFLLFLTALTDVEPGRAISIRNTSVAFGALLSLAAGERLIRAQWVGILLVVCGALLLV